LSIPAKKLNILTGLEATRFHSSKPSCKKNNN
jgi:hypothetical protein